MVKSWGFGHYKIIGQKAYKKHILTLLAILNFN